MTRWYSRLKTCFSNVMSVLRTNCTAGIVSVRITVSSALMRLARLVRGAIWLGPDLTFRLLEQGGLPQPAPVPVDQHLEDIVVKDQVEKIYCGTLTQFNEYWWFYPHKDEGGENTRYLALSAGQGEWFEGKMDRTAWVETGTESLPVAVSGEGYLYEHEYVDNTTGAYSAAGNPLEAACRTGDFYVDYGRNVVSIQGIQPDVKDQYGDLHLNLYAKDYPQSKPRLVQSVVMTPHQEKVDFRAQGRILQLEYVATGNHTRARIGTPVFEVQSRGRR